MALTAMFIMLGGAYYYFSRVALPNFRTTQKGVLYRSGQPRGVGLQFVKLYGIRTLINLRSSDDDSITEEKAFAAKNGLYFYNFPVGSSTAEIDETVQHFLAILADKSRWPILVHCSWGEERSGVLSAVYRMEYERWSNEDALAETYRLGLKIGSAPIKENYIKNYRPHWPPSRNAHPKPSEDLPSVP